MKIKTKTALTALLTAPAVALTGCSEPGLTVKGSTADIKKPGIRLTFPDGFEISVGDEVYDKLFEIMGEGFDSVKELRAEFEDNNESVLLQARSADANVMLIEYAKTDFSVMELMQPLHDNSLFDYRASGFFTEGSLEETEWGGAAGVLSVIRVYDEQGAPLLAEEREFCFERSDKLYSLQISSAGGFDAPQNRITLEVG